MVLGVPIFKLNIVSLKFAQILGHLKIINFPFLCVPILKHITVIPQNRYLVLKRVNEW